MAHQPLNQRRNQQPNLPQQYLQRLHLLQLQSQQDADFLLHHWLTTQRWPALPATGQLSDQRQWHLSIPDARPNQPVQKARFEILQTSHPQTPLVLFELELLIPSSAEATQEATID